MKIAEGFISINYQGVEYVLAKPGQFKYEDFERFLDPESDTKWALINQKTWTHIEDLAYREQQENK